MPRRSGIALTLLLVACAEVPERPTLPQDRAVQWVPEERARLGHVLDDAVADIGGETERLRAIAQFEVATDDPNHDGLRALLRLHGLDLRAAETDAARAAARARIAPSRQLFVDALTLAGPLAFDAILTHAPELLLSHPDEILRFLRSAHRVGAEGCSFAPPRAFYVDVVTRSLACRARPLGPIAEIFPRLRSDVRTWLRIRGFTGAGSGPSAQEARLMVQESFFGARGFMYAALQRGDVSLAARIATELRATDPRDVGVTLVLALADEIEEGVFPRDPMLVGLLTHVHGAAHVAHLVPQSQVAKLVLLEALAQAQLTEDYDTFRSSIPEDRLAALAPVLAHLDAWVRATRETSAAVPGDASLAVRAYLAAPFLRLHESSSVAGTDIAERLLTLPTPAFFPIVYPGSATRVAYRAQLLDRIDVPVLRARLRRELDCDSQWSAYSESCPTAPSDLETLEAIDLDASTFQALSHTRFWQAPALFALLARFEGTPVSAREEYVSLRLQALVFADERDEAMRRLATDGRVLSHGSRLALGVAHADTKAGRHPSGLPSLPPLLHLLRNALSRGCNEPYARSNVAIDPVDLGRTLTNAFARPFEAVDVDSLTAIARHLDGDAARLVAAYLALGALERSDRAGFDQALERATLPPGSVLAVGLAALARRVFDGERELPADLAWIDAYLDDRRRPSDDDASYGPVHSERAVPIGQPDELKGRAARAYAPYAISRSPRDAEPFLAQAALDENTRRVQCNVALELFPSAAVPYAEFRVPTTPRIRALLDVITRKCVLETPPAERSERALQFLRASMVDPPEAVREALTVLPAEAPWQDVYYDRDPLHIARVAVTPARRNYVLLRLVGMSRPLTLMLEHRDEAALRAARGDEETEHMLVALREDLARGNLDESAALAAISLLLPSRRQFHDIERRRTPILETLLELHPASRTLAWLAPTYRLRYEDDDRAFFASRIEQLLTIAQDDAALLRRLAVTFDSYDFDRAARRANERAAVLEPDYREPPMDANCDPPAVSVE